MQRRIVRLLPSDPRAGGFVAALLVFAVSAAVYAQYGSEGTLVRDDALYVYAGQQMTHGVAPYESAFDHKGPLMPMLCGLSVAFAQSLGADDLLTVRVVFWILSALTATALFLLGTQLFTSRGTGVLAAFVFLGFWGFGRHALSGPRAKIPMILFQVLMLLFAARARWFLAALCGSLSALVWQPGAVYALAALVLAGMQEGPGRVRAARVARALAGALLPFVGVGLYFAIDGSLGAVLADAFVHNVGFLPSPEISLLGRFGRITNSVFAGYAQMVLPIWMGLAAIASLYVSRVRAMPRVSATALLRDPFAGLLLTFPAPWIWSLMDYQEYPDFYVFLPYAALGFGWLLHLVACRLGAILPLRSPALLHAVLAVVLVALAAHRYHETSETGLRVQRRWAAEILERFGPDATVAAIEVPEVLVLLGQTNPSRHIILRGVERYIDETHPGGFAGWIDAIEAAEPSAIVVPRRLPRDDWLDHRLARDRTRQRIGRWRVYARRDDRGR